jgi:hypothetical protein
MARSQSKRASRYVVSLSALALLALGLGCSDFSDGRRTGGGTVDDAGRGDRGAGGGGCPGRGERNVCGGCSELGVVVHESCELDGEPPEGYCPFGYWECESADNESVFCQALQPSDEICDGIDNDCDTFADEDFDLLSNPIHCGSCGNECQFPNAVPDCVNGVCTVFGCQPGYTDADGNLDNGCEADCFPDGSPVDSCDGIDNDCDGFTDEDYIALPCGQGVCATTSSCTDGVDEPCVPLPPGEAVETFCDGEDSNCDGRVDEGLERVCENACGTGRLLCRNGEYPACSAISETGEVCIDIEFFCETIPVELTLQLPSAEEGLGVDVVFLFDRSGSFNDDIATFRAKANDLVTALGTEIGDLGVGLSSFVDAPCSGFGSGSDFGYQMNLAVTTETGRLATTLAGLDIRYGGDEPEAQLEGMYQSLTGEGVTTSCSGANIAPSNQGWRDRALSYLFVSTDATFHKPASGYPYPHSFSDVIDAALERGTRVYFLIAGGTIDDDAGRIASATEGAVFTLSSDSREIVETVTTAVLEALTFTDVRLVAENDDYGFVTDISPSVLRGVDLLTNSELDIRVTLLSPVNPTGTEQMFSFDLVFYVNDREVARRPVTIRIPGEDPKECSNRPPVIRSVDVEPSIEVSATTLIGVSAEDADDEPIFYQWTTTAGTILEPAGRSTVFEAPSTPGLVDLWVVVSDREGNFDSARETVLIRGGDCVDDTHQMDIGLTEGRMVLEATLDQSLATATCGGAGAEAMIRLDVHRSGTYRFGVSPGTGWALHIRARDCTTELHCGAAAEAEFDLEAGSYFLFIDSTAAASGTPFELFSEPVP